MQILTQQEFKDWLQNFETNIQPQKPDMFLGRAFILQFLDHANNQLFNLQDDQEALRYILSSYVDIELIHKAHIL